MRECFYNKLLEVTLREEKPDTNYEKLELNTWKSSFHWISRAKVQKTNFFASLSEWQTLSFDTSGNGNFSAKHLPPSNVNDIEIIPLRTDTW